MTNYFAEHPIQHPNFILVCLSLEAWDFKREHKARRQYTCRFCSHAIPAGTKYAAHSDRAAHLECRDEFRKMTPNAAPKAEVRHGAQLP